MEKHGDKISPDRLRELLGKQDPLVLEIGCNDGDDSAVFVDTFPEIRLHCFEPDPRPIRQFKKKLMEHLGRLGKASEGFLSGSVRLHEVAVADKPGQATFFQSSGTTKGAHKKDWDLSGSLNKPTGHLKQSPWCKFNTTINVPVITLDSFYKDKIDGETIDLIWMDVQGGERNVISGGRLAIDHTRYIYSEFGHWREPLYEGQMNLEQTIAYLGDDWECMATYEGYNLLARNKKYV